MRERPFTEEEPERRGSSRGCLGGRNEMRRGPQGPPPLWLIILVVVGLVLLVIVFGFPYLMGP